MLIISERQIGSIVNELSEEIENVYCRVEVLQDMPYLEVTNTKIYLRMPFDRLTHDRKNSIRILKERLNAKNHEHDN